MTHTEPRFPQFHSLHIHRFPLPFTLPKATVLSRPADGYIPNRSRQWISDSERGGVTVTNRETSLHLNRLYVSIGTAQLNGHLSANQDISPPISTPPFSFSHWEISLPNKRYLYREIEIWILKLCQISERGVKSVDSPVKMERERAIKAFD